MSKEHVASATKPSGLVAWAKGLAKDIVWIGGFVVLFHSFAFGAYHIPSGSMEPTLLIGDRIVVSKFAYGYSRHSLPFSPPLFSGRLWGRAPKRGDVAVFVVPEQDNEVFIKRVIGLPGDKVQMRGGRLYINDVIVPRRLVRQLSTRDAAGWPRLIQIYEETLPNGVAHPIAEWGDDRPLDNTPLFTVPDGQFLMMGDNRDNSNDSRAPHGFGLVTSEELIGRAEAISFSLARCDRRGGDGCFLGVPWGRFFKSIP
ncbi:MAG: signal peptidase I [Pseudomonadota bacterium]